MRAIGTAETIRDFLANRSLALVGLSRSGRKFSNNVYRELSRKGYRVFPINPGGGASGAIKVYASFRDLPEPVSAALIMVPRSSTPEVVREAAGAGVKSVWIQQGAESEEAIRYCEEQKVGLIHGECILMFAEPTGSFHRVHRFVWKVLGRLPH